MNARSRQARVFIPGRPFLPSLIFVGKARSLPKSGVPEKRFRDHIHNTSLSSYLKYKLSKLECYILQITESPANNKQSSLLEQFVSYEENKVL